MLTRIMSHGSRVRGCCERLMVCGACRTRVNSGKGNTVRAREGGSSCSAGTAKEMLPETQGANAGCLTQV